ncbi:MAG: hypothetical protein ACRDTC_02820 [Pseudonocardiaceae bacterium]
MRRIFVQSMVVRAAAVFTEFPVTFPRRGDIRADQEGCMPRWSSTVQALGLFVLGYVLVAGEPGVLINLVGVALCAWTLARRGLTTVPRMTAGAGPAVAVRALRRSRLRAVVPRAQDPDAAGHIRARAPSVLIPAV